MLFCVWWWKIPINWKSNELLWYHSKRVMHYRRCVMAAVQGADVCVSPQQAALSPTCTVWWSHVTSISQRSRPRACLLLLDWSSSHLNMYVTMNTHTHTHVRARTHAQAHTILNVLIKQTLRFSGCRLRPSKKSSNNQQEMFFITSNFVHKTLPSWQHEKSQAKGYAAISL